MNFQAKTTALRSLIHEMGSIIVGLSGGIDSTLVAKVAYEELGDRSLAVIGDSESLLPSEFTEAKELAEWIGIPYRVIRTGELANPNYARNPSNRCFFCKDELFSRLNDLARQLDYRQVVDGANQDDRGDYRPGMQAAAEHSVRHPLQEAGFSKAEVRQLARELGLPNWDKPALACLASRFPYGTEITADKLAMVAAAEEALKALGLRGFRVRHHETGDQALARIELAEEDYARMLEPEPRLHIDEKLREAGYAFVALDLQAYRSGRLNDALPTPLVNIEVSRA